MKKLCPDWARHQRTIIFWPCWEHRWAGDYSQILDEIALATSILASLEPVTVIVKDTEYLHCVKKKFGRLVDYLVLPIFGSWARDNGPLIVADYHGVEARCCQFNGYGGRFPKSEVDVDSQVAKLLANELGIKSQAVDFVMEGGSIMSNGDDTLLVGENCLLNPNRNPTITKEVIEASLTRAFGLNNVVWLPGCPTFEKGVNNTDGHIDLFVQLTSRNRAMMLASAPASSSYNRIYQNNQVILRHHGIEVEDLPFAVMRTSCGKAFLSSFVNFYICNNGILVPITGSRPEIDAVVIEKMRTEFPNREVIPICFLAHQFHGGGLHCVTLPIPSTDKLEMSLLRT